MMPALHTVCCCLLSEDVPVSLIGGTLFVVCSAQMTLRVKYEIIKPNQCSLLTQESITHHILLSCCHYHRYCLFYCFYMMVFCAVNDRAHWGWFMFLPSFYWLQTTTQRAEYCYCTTNKVHLFKHFDYTNDITSRVHYHLKVCGP